MVVSMAHQVEDGFHGTPKRGLPPPINSEVFFKIYWSQQVGKTFCMDFKLDMYKHLVLRHIRHFWRICEVINVRILCHLAVLGYRNVIKCVINSWFSHKICVSIGFTTLLNSMCNRLFVVELWRRTRPIWNDGLLVQHVLLLRSLWNFTSRYVLWREVNSPNFEMTSPILTELWRHKLSDMTSKFDDVISPSKMSALLWNFVDLLTLL